MLSDPRHYVRVATEAFTQRDRDGAAAAIAALVEEQAPIGSTWGPISRMAKALHEVSLAIAAHKMFMAEAPIDRNRVHELGSLYMHFGRVDEAIVLGEELVARFPGEHASHQFLGTTYSTGGQGAKAIDHFRKALLYKPHATDTWLSLAQQKKWKLDDPEVKELKRIVDLTPPEPKAQRGTILYAYGKMLDDAGDVEGSFDSYTRGAELIRDDSGYKPENSEAYVDAVTSQWDEAFFKRLSPSTELSDRIIFVMGLPRSGTTLTEQIIVSHSAVEEGAETAIFAKAAFAVPNFLPDNVIAANNDPRWGGDYWSRAARAYLHLMTERFGAKGRLVDKTLHYPRMLGGIAHCLPNAKFVWLRRDPAAIAWSCFRTRFVDRIDWSWSLTDIGHHFALEDRLFAHWSKLMPDRILPLQYEDLVDDPETQIPRILNFVGLPDEPQTRNFHEVERVVKTASVVQVRQPMYKTSVAGWKRYEKQLQPFFDSYHASTERFARK